MDTKSLAHPGAEIGVDERIRRDARAYTERTYSGHVAAAEEIAAESYREEIRAMMRADTLDPDEADEGSLEGV